MVVMANGDAAGTRGVAGAHLPEAVGRFLGGRRRLVVGTRHGSRGGLGRRCGRSVALGQAAASCTGGSRGVGGGSQQPHRAEQRPPTLPHPIPLHPHPIPIPMPCGTRGEHPAAGDEEGAEPFQLPSCAPHIPPPRCHAKPRPRCRHPSPAQASGFLMQRLGRQSCRRATETLKPLCWDGEMRGGMQGGPLPGGGSGPATAHPRGSR